MNMKRLIVLLLLTLLPGVSSALPDDNQLARSPVVALSGGGATITLQVGTNFSHNFAGVIYFNDDSGADSAMVTPTAGTETYSVESILQPGTFQTFNNNTLNAMTPNQVDWSVNTNRVRVVLSGVTGNGATHARLIFFGNEQ